jgi:hypothetical protein
MLSEIAEVAGAILARKTTVPLENLLRSHTQQSRISFDLLFSPWFVICEHRDHTHILPTDEFDERSLPVIQGISEMSEVHLFLR